MKTTHSAKTVDFNVKLSENEKGMLAALAKDANITMSEIMRATISKRFRMRFANEPTCCIGSRCLCPNMHTLQDAARPTDADILEGLGEPDAGPAI